MSTIISVKNLSKLYHIGRRDLETLENPLGSSLRESLMSLIRDPRRLVKKNGQVREELWALKDVSFEAKHGDILGIVGSNGAGKSTLLKVLSRITQPTTGRVELYGRVGSLLEVGTGFHPELSGRENVFLNGAILGMKREETRRKFDEIVAFSEMERFIDTPVKYYSSGMYTRLAFSVAAHLDPEVLIVDEVLAVGDASFQKKCLGKMGDVARLGRTVLFVTHNMTAIQALCTRAIWLRAGSVVEDGSPTDVIAGYLGANMRAVGLLEEFWENSATAPGNDSVRLHSVRVRQVENNSYDLLTVSTPFDIEVEYWNLVSNARLHVTLLIYTEESVLAFTTGNGTSEFDWGASEVPKGLIRAVCHVPGNLLNTGWHRFAVLIFKDKATRVLTHESRIAFEIADLEKREEGSWLGREPGIVRPRIPWTTSYLGDESPSGSA